MVTPNTTPPVRRKKAMRGLPQRLMLKILLAVYLFYLLVAAPLFLYFYFHSGRSSSVGGALSKNPIYNTANNDNDHSNHFNNMGDKQNEESSEEEEEDDSSDDDDDDDDGVENNNEAPENLDDDTDVAVNKLWHGRNALASLPKKMAVSIVISHCEGELGWLVPYISGLGEYKSITIVSKCGIVPKSEDLPEGTQLLTLSNVGRCDHTMANWMAQRVPSSTESYDDNEVILFLKDNFVIHQRAVVRDIQTVLSIALDGGFGCVLDPKEGISLYHETELLSTFKLGGYERQDDDNDIFVSKYENLGAFWSEMNISMPTPLTSVCYGGMYAVKTSRVASVPMSTRENMEKSLSRADSIEEGHFAERTWAGLLSLPISLENATKLRERSRMIYPNSDSYLGALMKYGVVFSSSSGSDDEGGDDDDGL